MKQLHEVPLLLFNYLQIVQLAEAQGGNPSITWLHRLRQQPKEYVCDVEPYLGPSLEEFI